MTVQITLDLPDSIYQYYQELAISKHRALDHLLLERLSVIDPVVDVHPERALMEREVKAFAAQHARLWQQYPEEYVALHNGKVIDHDRDEQALVNRVDAKFPDEIVLIRQVLPTLPSELVFRSPRFIPEHA
jgi:Family of unknown function (DUF5678)